MNCNLVQNLKHFFTKNNTVFSKGCFITATGTDVGKSYCSAHILKALNGIYFKPIQAGDLDKGGDTALIKQLSGLDDTHFLDPIYNLQHPLSPHEAAIKQDIQIDLDQISLPKTDRPIIVEGAGGVMVPINKKHFIIDIIEKFALPVILVVRSELGTLNHSLLTLQALRLRNISVKAIIMNGPKMINNLESLQKISGIDNIFISEQ